MDMWTIGVADRLRFPRFPSSSEGGEMLAFAHIPTGTTANKGLSRKSKPVGIHLKTWLRLSHVRGPPHTAASQNSASLLVSGVNGKFFSSASSETRLPPLPDE